MLRYLACSGFKSFENFHIAFEPGLNVIVGPNGSGKTNLILLLQFLSSLRTAPLIEAIGSIGGAGTAFRRSNAGLTNDITIYFRGSGIYTDYYSDNKSMYGEYEYEATISLIIREGAIVFRRQRFRAVIDRSDSPRIDGGRRVTPTIDLETSLNGDGGVDVDIHSIDEKEIRYSHKDKSAGLEQIKDVSKSAGKTYCLLAYAAQFVRGGDFAGQDLWGARSYNILPSKVRQPEDIASYPHIQPDGSGLAATLYALQTDSVSQNFYYNTYVSYRPSFSNAALLRSQIISSGRLINDSIEDISVASDAFEGKLRIYVALRHGDQVTTLPFSFVSDGTAKWYALVAAVITNRRLFAIEEPENFLHPMMQTEIVNLVRSQYSGKSDSGEADSERFAIITTHSETILNKCTPDELIIINMEQGHTTAHRTTNADDLNREIRRTGFGLGYYYLSGAIE